MRCRNTKTWTFLSLVGAFLDLTITFLVLFCSFITFLTSKLLSLFYLDLPCPCCSGLFSAGGDKCPLASGPVTTIRFVQNAAKRRPPFDSMWVAERDESCGSSHFLGRQNSSPTPSVTRRFSISNNKRFDVDGCSEDGEKVRMLERALEEERNAAASAADEAMLMIDKIQKDKATVEMNARQYKRMMEEKSIYDEDEMEKLKEIIIRREKKVLELENKVETYKKIVSANSDVTGRQENWIDEEQEDEEDETSEMLHEIFESVRKKEKVKFSNKIWRGVSSRMDNDGDDEEEDNNKAQNFPIVTTIGDVTEMDYQEKGVVSVDRYKTLLHPLPQPPPPPPPPNRRLDRSLEHEFELEICSHPESESAAEEFDVHVMNDDEDDADDDDKKRSILDAEIEGFTRKLKNVLRDQNEGRRKKKTKKLEKDDLQLKLLQEISLQIRNIHQQSV
ncbi:hypothetical protein ZOSMA_15G00800 [Zostera marina]|uniref:GTD-binding domain-containing protein n=1 Tax=Zostera marina TaxID=29655 RepID=A0A0K9PWX3_ZOSMR|nr:hypothetical protein ZOSMA_15G00800 [Zostera marina]